MTVSDREQVRALVVEAVAQGARQHTAYEIGRGGGAPAATVAAPGDGRGWSPGTAHGSTQDAVTA